MSTTTAPAAPRHGIPPGHARTTRTSATGEAPLARWLLIGAALAYLFLFLGLPLFVVFQEAFKKGVARVFHGAEGAGRCCTR